MNAIKQRTMGTDEVEEWLMIYDILFPGFLLPPISYLYADEDSSVAVQDHLIYFQAEAPSSLLDLVRSKIDGRIPLNAKYDDILYEAFEYAAAGVVSPLRPRFDEFALPTPAIPGNARPAAGLNCLPLLSRIVSNAGRLAPPPSSDHAWPTIHVEQGEWHDFGQEGWLNLEQADCESYEVGALTASGAI